MRAKITEIIRAISLPFSDKKKKMKRVSLKKKIVSSSVEEDQTRSKLFSPFPDLLRRRRKNKNKNHHRSWNRTSRSRSPARGEDITLRVCIQCPSYGTPFKKKKKKNVLRGPSPPLLSLYRHFSSTVIFRGGDHPARGAADKGKRGPIPGIELSRRGGQRV